jgi:hypothetical protein
VAQAFVDGSSPVVPVAEPDRNTLPAGFVLVAVVFAILLSAALTLALVASLQPT